MITYRKGQILALSAGEYSDYSVYMFAKVLKDFTQQEVVDLYPGNKEDYNFDEDKFLKFLVDNRYVKEIDYVEWNFSCYGKPLIDK